MILLTGLFNILSFKKIFLKNSVYTSKFQGIFSILVLAYVKK